MPGWPRSLTPLAHTLPAADLSPWRRAATPQFLWALVLHRLRAGDDEAQALADTVVEVAEAAPGARLNFLLTNGETITATAWGDTSGTSPSSGRRTQSSPPSRTTTIRTGPRCPTARCSRPAAPTSC